MVDILLGCYTVNFFLDISTLGEDAIMLSWNVRN
jgi:hypothetical protein